MYIKSLSKDASVMQIEVGCSSRPIFEGFSMSRRGESFQLKPFCITGCVLDKEGKVILEQKFKNEPHSMDLFLSNIQQDSKIALE